MSDIETNLPDSRDVAERTCMGRRRLLQVGLAATPVVLAVSGRSAMAAPCFSPPMSAAVYASLNIAGTNECVASSHHPVSSFTAGRSPGFWTPNPIGQTFQPPYAWTISPFTKIKTISGSTCTWNAGSYLTYKDLPKDATGWSTGTRYNALFKESFDRRSFSRILLDDNGSLAWHFCAAYLNATALQGLYAMTVTEVLAVAATGCLVPGGNVLTDEQIKAFLSQTWV